MGHAGRPGDIIITGSDGLQLSVLPRIVGIATVTGPGKIEDMVLPEFSGNRTGKYGLGPAGLGGEGPDDAIPFCHGNDIRRLPEGIQHMFTFGVGRKIQSLGYRTLGFARFD